MCATRKGLSYGLVVSLSIFMALFLIFVLATSKLQLDSNWNLLKIIGGIGSGILTPLFTCLVIFNGQTNQRDERLSEKNFS